MHTWDECEPAMIQLDVYTCGELNTDVVFDFLKQFDPVKIDYKYLDRETGLREIPVKENVVIPLDTLLSPDKEQILSIN